LLARATLALLQWTDVVVVVVLDWPLLWPPLTKRCDISYQSGGLSVVCTPAALVEDGREKVQFHDLQQISQFLQLPDGCTMENCTVLFTHHSAQVFGMFSEDEDSKALLGDAVRTDHCHKVDQDQYQKAALA